MARHLTQKSLIPQDENLDILRKKSVAKGKPTGGSKLEAKKLGAGFGSRKALGDITNKSSLPHEASLKRKKTPKEEPNISEETFLHDHRKCIESQKVAMRTSFWDIVLPGCGIFSGQHKSEPEHPIVENYSTEVPVSPLGTLEMRSMKSDLDIDSECFYPEPVEIPMSDFTDLFKSSSLPSPPSPTSLDSPPLSPFAEFGPVEFVLKEDNDPCS